MNEFNDDKIVIDEIDEYSLEILEMLDTLKEYLSSFSQVENVDIPRSVLIGNEIVAFDIEITFKTVDMMKAKKVLESVKNLIKNSDYKINGFHYIVSSESIGMTVKQGLTLIIEVSK